MATKKGVEKEKFKPNNQVNGRNIDPDIQFQCTACTVRTPILSTI